MIAAVGASVVSQLYQSLTGRTAGTQTTKGTPFPGPPPGPPPDAVSGGGPGPDSPISKTSAKGVADLRAMLLGLQSDGGTAA